MKKNFFLALLCMFFFGAKAQSPLEKGGFQLNAGVGTSGWGIPVYVGIDYGIHEDITLGAELSYRSDSHSYVSYKYKTSVIGIEANGNFHFDRILKIPSKWDLYAGANVNYYIWNYDNELYKQSGDSELGIGGQVGGRYFFTDRFGINLELKATNATNGAKFGITYKL